MTLHYFSTENGSNSIPAKKRFMQTPEEKSREKNEESASELVERKQNKTVAVDNQTIGSFAQNGLRFKRAPRRYRISPHGVNARLEAFVLSQTANAAEESPPSLKISEEGGPEVSIQIAPTKLSLQIPLISVSYA